MRKKFAAISLIVSAALLTGCGGEDSSSVPSEIIVDGTSAVEEQTSLFPLQLEDGIFIERQPESVASLSPAVTEILSELGFGDRLCAVSRYCDYPENVCNVTVGSCENPDIDKLTGLAPDILFTLTPLAEREYYTLENAGITVVTLSTPDSASGYGKLYGTIVTVFEGKEAGSAAAEKAEKSLSSAAEGIDLGSFVYITPKLSAAGAGTFESAVLSLCGKNLFTGDGYALPEEDTAEIPQYIIAADTLSESDIAAVKPFSEMLSGGAKLLFVPAERFERPSARLTEIFSAIKEQLSGNTEQTE